VPNKLSNSTQNLVRKSVYYNYQYYKDLGTHAFKNDEDILQLHISQSTFPP